MTLYELQEPPEDEYPFFDETLRTLRRQYDNGSTPPDQFHSQATLVYSWRKDPYLTRVHAKRVPETTNPHWVAEAKVAVARILVFEKNIPEAIETYQQALQSEADHEVAHEELAHCLVNVGRYEESLTHFDCALESFDNDNEDLWEGKGKALAELRRFEDAIDCFKKAIEYCRHVSSHCVFHNNIGQCYHSLEDNYRALSHYRQALDIKPDYAEAIQNMGAVYFNDNEDLYDVQVAIDHLKRAEAIAESKGNSQLLTLVYRNLGTLYQRVAEFELAEEYKAKMMDSIGFSADLLGFLEQFDPEGLMDEDEDEFGDDEYDESADDEKEPGDDK
jgi:tetratricopeptide (TPR) repeat protein